MKLRNLVIVLGNGGGWCVVEMACTCLGGFLMGGSNIEKWGDHRNRNFFMNNSVEALVPLKEGHHVLEVGGWIPVWQKMGLSPKKEFCLKRKNNM